MSNSVIYIPEWAKGSDNLIKIFLPLPYADYENIIVAIIDNRNKKVEAQYSVNTITGYISTGVEVFYDEVNPKTGDIQDGVSIQIRRAQSSLFQDGIKYAEIEEQRTDVDWADGEKHLIGRQFFASYYAVKV